LAIDEIKFQTAIACFLGRRLVRSEKDSSIVVVTLITCSDILIGNRK
jgi:hypothetical protein